MQIITDSTPESNGFIRVVFYPDSANDVTQDTMIGYITIKLSDPPLLQIYPCTSSLNEYNSDESLRYTELYAATSSEQTQIWVIRRDDAMLIIERNYVIIHQEDITDCSPWLNQKLAKIVFWRSDLSEEVKDTASLRYSMTLRGLVLNGSHELLIAA